MDTDTTGTSGAAGVHGGVPEQTGSGNSNKTGAAGTSGGMAAAADTNTTATDTSDGDAPQPPGSTDIMDNQPVDEDAAASGDNGPAPRPTVRIRRITLRAGENSEAIPERSSDVTVDRVNVRITRF